MTGYILAIDQGTTSSRAIVYGPDAKPIAIDQKEISQSFPKSGWVEHDAIEIWESVLETSRNALLRAGIEARDVAAIGITNQRETCLVWERSTGKPIHPAIVWQDRRTYGACEVLRADGFGPLIQDKTGLLLDPYFSATKIAWILDNVEGARRAAEAGQLLCGTIDTYLTWMLTGGAVHATDATNASRTSLFDIRENRWDEELLGAFKVPRALLPEVKDCADDFGQTIAGHFGAEIPIRAIAGDQQSALIGQACLKPGMLKSTYGTGCFVVLNTGDKIVRSTNRLLSTIAYRLDGKTTYALEGSIFMAGAAVQWLRDSLKLIKEADETGRLAHLADEQEDVYLVPAFTGLGAPHWNSQARGAIFGLTRGTGVAELSRATLESVCYQTRDLLEAMASDYPMDVRGATLRVDGGLSGSDWAMQALADCLGSVIERSQTQEATAYGVAALAGSRAGVWPDLTGFAANWEAKCRFTPNLNIDERARRYRKWRAAVASTLSYAASA
ncbi:glycerol kinase GlpK [Agrobacterium rhizogenes]|uniref:glycerol kinase GlpK n=1 Tax=Rhizobium rhizogenes TaxID=359 RepID=UPI001571628A|nr:glycerol kinase GlpK [Rhizobium rhizogenes]NTF91546.1 glycerol kinase GlpK [Rhizobium rhizogenes]